MSGHLALVIGPDERARMADVIALAERRPVPLEVLEHSTPENIVGLYGDFTFDIPMGFTVIYTHEVQRQGLMRHMSMSVHLNGRVPNPVAVQMVMKEMGFVNDLAHCYWWEEAVGDGDTAINVIEPLDGDWKPFLKEEDQDAHP